MTRLFLLIVKSKLLLQIKKTWIYMMVHYDFK